ncbi:MAG: type II toxin-antitoxin system RelE/ParE family toxin [Bdellovibrionales bacterium]
MGRQVILAPAAHADIEAIMHYTVGRWVNAQWEKYKATLDKIIFSIAAKPEGGSRKRGMSATVLSRRAARHVVFYIVDEKIIPILRILHERMDFRRHTMQ